MENIKQELLRFPHQAYEYSQTWKHLLSLYPNFNWDSIKSQEDWDAFFQTISQQKREGFPSDTISDPKIWQYGPVSQDRDVQQAIHEYISPKHDDVKEDQDKKSKQEKIFSLHSAVSGQVIEKNTKNGKITPLPGVIITIENPENDKKIASFITAKNGTFISPPLQHGDYKISFVLPSMNYRAVREVKLSALTQPLIVTFTYSADEDDDDEVDNETSKNTGSSEEENINQKRATQTEAAATIGLAASQAQLSEQEQAAKRIQEAVDQAPPAPISATLNAAEESKRSQQQKTFENTVEGAKPPSASQTDFVSTNGQTLIHVNPVATNHKGFISTSGRTLSSQSPSETAPDVFPDISPSPPLAVESRGISATFDEYGDTIQEEGGQEENESPYNNVNELQDKINSAQKANNSYDTTQEIKTRVPKTPEPPQPATSMGGSQGGQPPRPPGRPRAPGMGGIGKAANAGRTAVSSVRAVTAGPVIAFFSSPPGWITLAIIIILIIFLIITGGLGTLDDSEVNVSVNKTGPEQVANPGSQDPSDIEYKIQVSWSGGPNSVVVTDKIPDNTEFVSAGNGGTYDQASRTVTWNISGSGSNSQTTDPEDPRTQSRFLDHYISPNLQKNLLGLEDTISKTVIQQVYAATVSFSTYTQTPYNLPSPSGPSDIEFTEESIQKLNNLGNLVAKHQAYLSSKHGSAKLVDPFLSVIWNGAIEGLGGSNYFWNCQDNRSITINDGCAGGYYSGGWQVGWGVQVSQSVSHLAEDFEEVYGQGSADDPQIAQQVGQAVINNAPSPITNPSSFPNKSVQTLISEAGSSTAARQAIAILLMDPELGAIVVAREIAGDIGSENGNWASTMCGWGSYYCNGMQTFANRASAIAERYTGVGGAIGGGLGSGSETLSLTLRPKDPDSWVINYVTAQAIGGGTGGSGMSVPAGSVDGHCTPTGSYPSDPSGELANKYNVTLNGYGAEGTKMIYELMTCLSPSQFPSLLANANVTIVNGETVINGNSTIGMGCDGKNCSVYIPENTNAFKFILTHELGHVINSVNTHEVLHFSEFENAWATEGGLSPYSEGGNGCSKGGVYEDFAEMVAYYYNPTSGGPTAACDTRSNPPNSLFGTSDFPHHLEVAKKVL